MSKQSKKIREITLFNPLDKKNLAESAASALLAEPPAPMSGLVPFVGAGVYAIYYVGDFHLYFLSRGKMKMVSGVFPSLFERPNQAGAARGGISMSLSRIRKRICTID